MTNRTSHLRIPYFYALPLSHRLYIEQGTLRSLYMTRVPHTARIRGSAMSLASYFIYRIRKLFRFELGKEIEKVRVVRRFQPKRLHPR